MYFDYGGSHSSVTAACIHTEKLDPENLPGKEQFMNMPYLDKTTPEDFGRIKFVGNDSGNNEVYALGTKSSNLGNLLNDLINIQGISDHFILVSTSPYVNMTLRIGGWLSRSASLPFLGRPLVIRGLQKAYPKLCSLVETIDLKAKGTIQ